MAGNFSSVNFASGISVDDQSMVEKLESKTLVENVSDKGILDDGVRVSGEGSKVLVGELIGESGLGDGNIRINDECDGFGNRVVEKVYKDNEWKSWGLMERVERLLSGKSFMDEEVGDVKKSESGPQVDSVSNVNTWRDVVDEPTSENGAVINGTGARPSFLIVDTSYRGLKRHQYLASNEQLTDGKSEIEEINDAHDDILIPKARGERDTTEKEGEYYESDLVWGKVMSHPWWPGQIFSPKAATGEAAKYFKKGCYLIAYFDGTFAWNEESKIKPFRMYFSQMEKQSNSEDFHYAVDCAIDEVARRIEFGLSCTCLPKEVHDKIKSQVVENAGVVETYSIREGGDNLSSAASFSPREVLQFIESLAVSPHAKPDRLQLEVRKAQLLAINRLKGYYQLPVFDELGVLLKDVDDLMEVSEGVNEVPSKKRKSNARDGFSRKRRHCDEEGSTIKGNCKSDLVSSSSSNSDKKKKSAKKTHKNCEMVNSGENLTPDVVLSKLKKLAKNPMGEYEDMTPVNKWFRELRALSFGVEGTEDLDPDEHEPTSLILNFTDLESIPSTDKLNEIFRRFGPLKESQTKRKRKRAKVTFKRREDAERAYSSPGKYSIFGAALLSYSLKYL